MGERLRLMKAEELRLQQALTAARKPYDQWNGANAATSASTKDPKAVAIAAELSALAAGLPPLATPP